MIAASLAFTSVNTTRFHKAPAIGDARLEKDGSIAMQLRRTADGIHTSAMLTYKTTDKDYEDVLKHQGGSLASTMKYSPKH